MWLVFEYVSNEKREGERNIHRMDGFGCVCIV